MNNKSIYLAIYMIKFTLVAILTSSLGALIPFLADAAHVSQTQYSYLFVFISAGCITGALLFKYFQVKKILPQLHTICIITSVGSIIFSLMFLKSSTIFQQCICIGILSILSYTEVIVVNICLILVPSKQEVGLWMAATHGSFGIGALFGPILISYFDIKIYLYAPIFIALLIPFLYYQQSPKQVLNNSENEDKNSISYFSSKKLELMTSLALFLLVGLEATIGGWAPSYAVLSQVADKQKATIFATLFWLLSTIFRFVFGFMKTKDSIKLRYLIMGQVVCGFISTLMAITGLSSQAVYFCSISYGITLSQLFPLLLSVTGQFDIKFSSDQIANIMLSFTLSSGIFTTLTGVLMIYDLNNFFYSLLVMSFMLAYSGYLILSLLVIQSQANQKSYQLKQTLAK